MYHMRHELYLFISWIKPNTLIMIPLSTIVILTTNHLPGLNLPVNICMYLCIYLFIFAFQMKCTIRNKYSCCDVNIKPKNKITQHDSNLHKQYTGSSINTDSSWVMRNRFTLAVAWSTDCSFFLSFFFCVAPWFSPHSFHYIRVMWHYITIKQSIYKIFYY